MTDKQADEMGHKVRQMMAAIDSKAQSGHVIGYAGEISQLSGVPIVDVLSMAEFVYELQSL